MHLDFIILQDVVSFFFFASSSQQITSTNIIKHNSRVNHVASTHNLTFGASSIHDDEHRGTIARSRLSRAVGVPRKNKRGKSDPRKTDRETRRQGNVPQKYETGEGPTDGPRARERVVETGGKIAREKRRKRDGGRRGWTLRTFRAAI